jgi:hypothetical protein
VWALIPCFSPLDEGRASVLRAKRLCSLIVGGSALRPGVLFQQCRFLLIAVVVVEACTCVK